MKGISAAMTYKATQSAALDCSFHAKGYRPGNIDPGFLADNKDSPCSPVTAQSNVLTIPQSRRFAR